MPNSPSSEKSKVRIGYVPLVDCAPLVIAQEAGFFWEENIEVKFHRESNWASIRDKLSLGMIDAAHMLAPMVLASQMPPTNREPDKSFVTGLALGYNGNAITLSNHMFDILHASGKNLSEILKSLKDYVELTNQKLTFGTVHPHSMHTYLLYLLMNKAGIERDKIAIKVIPPVRMVAAMEHGDVDLFCVGEPWNTAAQFAQVGKIICYGSELWSHAPEKVLGVNYRFAEENREVHVRLLRALVKACQWLEESDHMAQAALWLSSPEYLNCSSDLLLHAMVNQWHAQSLGKQQRKIFFSCNANAPWPAHAQWITGALAHQKPPADSIDELTVPIEKVYDWDIYSEVMESLQLTPPAPADAPGQLPEL